MIEEFMRIHPEASRETAIKFSVGRKFVRERVEECYASYQKTIREHHFESVTVADVLEELRTQKLYIPGSRDKQGAALFVINAGRHVPGQFPTESTLKLAFYLGEVLTRSPRTSQVGVTLISNMEGMEWANFDNQFQRNVIDFFQENIPARVKNILLYKCPWWVSMMVRMVSPFLKQKIRERIHILNEGELTQFVDREQLPTDLGGSYEYDHEGFIRREMSKAPAALPAFKSTVAEGEAEDRQITEEIMRRPPGTTALVPDELARELEVERERVLLELDERIRIIQKTIREHTVPTDITRLLRSRTTRLSLDMDAIPIMEPGMLQTKNISQPSTPLTERAGEDYSQEGIEERIGRSIRKDRHSYLVGHGLLPEEDQESESSFTPPSGEPAEQRVPVVPKPKARFSAVVEIFKPPTPPEEEEEDEEEAVGPNLHAEEVKRPLEKEEGEEEESSVPRGAPRRRPRQSRVLSSLDAPKERRRQRTAIYSVEGIHPDLDEQPAETLPTDKAEISSESASQPPRRQRRTTDDRKQRNRTAVYSAMPDTVEGALPARSAATGADGADPSSSSATQSDRKSRRTAFIGTAGPFAG